MATRLSNNFTVVPAISLKSDYTTLDIWSALTINSVEDSLDSIADITHAQKYYKRKKIDKVIGGKAWNFIDLNRIGNNLNVIDLQIINREQDNRQRLKFTLGGGDL